MKKLLSCLTLVGLLVLALGGMASAQPPTLAATVAGTNSGSATPVWTALADPGVPTVTAVDPVSAPNDIDTAVTITGTGFATDGTGTILPTVALGTTPLTNVTFVDATTLTATVPWGMDPGVYDLTVVNPDGGTGSLTGAFTVEQGIGKWNGGSLFGGEVDQILMKPGDPNTLYAPAYDIVGLFRSTDAAEHWTYVSADVSIGNGKLAIDPLHPDWLYGCTYKGLQRSQDEGVTWTTVMANVWPDGRALGFAQVYPSPNDPQVLFVSSYYEPLNGGSPDCAEGLLKSTDGGASWQSVADLNGISVEDVAFHPTNPLQMVLVTRDARVFHSSDGGDTWTEVAKPATASIGIWGVIAYNPYRAGEVWIASVDPDVIYKSADAALTGWHVEPSSGGMGGLHLTFTGPDSVYTTRYHSTDGGQSWDRFGPITGKGELVFDPNDPQIGYLGDAIYGVQKTTDGGQTWEVKSQGLAGMTCDSLDVSRADPLRVYATFSRWPGIYRSDDGASNWTSFPIAGSYNMRLVREDPFGPQRLYVGADSGFCVSTDGGESWSNLGWNLPPSSPAGGCTVMEPDPFQAGHLLVGFGTGPYESGPGYLYASSDAGVSWQAVTMPQDLKRITDIAFDPETPGLVYLTTGGTGVYGSTDSGGTWARIDDPQQPEMQDSENIVIATHPRHVLFVLCGKGAYRSFDDGVTWEQALDPPGGVSCSMFVDGDSTRLYDATGTGLFFSSDVGDTWTPAAGAFGHLQILNLGYADMNGHTILYAATNGGQAGAAKSTAGATSPRAATRVSTPVAAGIYRYVVVNPKVTLKLSGLRRGALRLGKRVTAKGVVMPTSLAGAKVTLSVQRQHNGKWLKVTSLTRTIGASGTYSRTYKPARKCRYRMRASIAKSGTNMAAKTKWRKFKVK